MCQPFMSQCGGNGWVGGTSCCGSTCYSQTEYHSQCRDDCPWDWDCSRASQFQGTQQQQRSWFTSSHEARNPFDSDAMESAAADPNVQSLFMLLKLMGVLLLLAACSFAKIRLNALRSKVAASRDPDQCDETAEMIDDAAAPKLPRRKAKSSKDAMRTAKVALAKAERDPPKKRAPGKVVRR